MRLGGHKSKAGAEDGSASWVSFLLLQKLLALNAKENTYQERPWEGRFPRKQDMVRVCSDSPAGSSVLNPRNQNTPGGYPVRNQDVR